MKVLRTILILFAVALAFLGGYAYRNFVHPAPAPARQNGRRILYYVDPMHPAYKSDKPGIAPDCGMKLEPVYADAGGAAGPTPQGGEPGPAHESNAPMPPGTVHVSARKQQLIGVRYGVAELAGGSDSIRAVGKVAYDETRLAHVHTRVEGWLDKVYADFTGQMVQKGQPLLTIYSPEMLASERELLLAARARELMKKSPLESSLADSNSLLEASRQRLRLFDLSEAQIDRVLETGRPIDKITLYSPVSGFIIDRKAFPNQKVTPDMDLYTVADLSRVWIMADVFESDAPSIRVGQTARVSLSYTPGRAFTARVNYIQPEVDPTTRTLKVRLDADNPGFALRPDMFVDVDLRVARPPSVTVPAEAVLDTGDRQTVFVDRGNGYFEPRAVEVGDNSGGRVTILKGLQAGERIVTSGTFLIDSESQLKAAAEGMSDMGGAHH